MSIFLISAIFICGLLFIFFFIKIKVLKSKINKLKKEIEIQGDASNYEKTQYLNSLNQVHSITLILTEIVQEISSVLGSEKEILEEDVLRVLFEKIKNLLKPKKCVLFRVNLKDNSLDPLFVFGYAEKLMGIDLSSGKDTLPCWAVVTQRFISVYDVEADPTLKYLLDKDYLSCQYFQPIKIEGVVKALICVGRIQEQLPETVVTRLFSIISNISSGALVNATLMQQLRQQSIRDGLTGLYNHSYFQNWLENLLKQPLKEKRALILAMLDLDNFKSVNDTYGHPVGDVVLRTIAGFLKDIDAAGYFCARYGGEEFILGFPDKRALDISLALEKFRQRVELQEFNADEGKFSRTVSIGILEVNLEQGKIPKRGELVDRVDKILYKAKTSGKNKIVIEEY